MDSNNCSAFRFDPWMMDPLTLGSLWETKITDQVKAGAANLVPAEGDMTALKRSHMTKYTQVLKLKKDLQKATEKADAGLRSTISVQLKSAVQVCCALILVFCVHLRVRLCDSCRHTAWSTRSTTRRAVPSSFRNSVWNRS